MNMLWRAYLCAKGQQPLSPPWAPPEQPPPLRVSPGADDGEKGDAPLPPAPQPPSCTPFLRDNIAFRCWVFACLRSKTLVAQIRSGVADSLRLTEFYFPWALLAIADDCEQLCGQLILLEELDFERPGDEGTRRPRINSLDLAKSGRRDSFSAGDWSQDLFRRLGTFAALAALLGGIMRCRRRREPRSGARRPGP